MSSDLPPVMFPLLLQNRSRNRTPFPDLRFSAARTSENRTEVILNLIRLNPAILIHLSPSAPNQGLIDRYDYRKEIKLQIDYSSLYRQYTPEDVDGVLELIVDTLSSTRQTVRIGGETIPISQVQNRLLSLEQSHLEYVFDCLRRNSTKIRNIRAYLLTALYNAPLTIGQFYQAEVQHDFGAINTGF